MQRSVISRMFDIAENSTFVIKNEEQFDKFAFGRQFGIEHN